MENFVVLLILVLLTVLLVRMVMVPMQLAYKLALHAGCGFACLWLLNTIAPFSGITFPVNAVTILIAGFLGVPGIGVLALLEIIG